MPVTLIIQLLTTFGPSAVQLITSLIGKWETNGTVTAAEWSTLTASLSLNAQSQMLAMLAKAGIDPASPQGVAMLEASK